MWTRYCLMAFLVACSGADLKLDPDPELDRDDIDDASATQDAGEPDDSVTLSISVKGQRSSDGQVCWAIFRDGNGWPDDANKAIVQGCEAFSALPAQVSLKPGRYGVSVFHDANSNETLDTNIIGMPKEGYGFSNNPKAGFGAPSWSEVAFDVAFDSALEVKFTYL